MREREIVVKPFKVDRWNLALKQSQGKFEVSQKSNFTPTMLRRFRAWLKGSRLEWIDEIPEFGDRLIQVHVTVLENEPDLEAKSRGRKMAEILEKLSACQVLSDVDPVVWQCYSRRNIGTVPIASAFRHLYSDRLLPTTQNRS